MTKTARRWVRVKELTSDEKSVIGQRFGAFIVEILAPRFLPEIRPTPWNYPILLHGKWRGSKYSFIVRYRSSSGDSPVQEFDAPWVRLDHDEACFTEARFHIMWHRHTGQWFPYQRSVTLDEALQMIETDPILQPHL